MTDKITEINAALESENKSLKDVITRLNAEKMIIDQMFTRATQESVSYRTHAVILESKYQALEAEFATLKKNAKPHLVEEDAA